MQRPFGGPTKEKQKNERGRQRRMSCWDRLSGQNKKEGGRQSAALTHRLRRKRMTISMNSMIAPATAAARITAVLLRCPARKISHSLK